MSPVIYPKVTIGGQSYQLKFGMNAVFRLNKWGVPVDNLSETIEQYRRSGQNIVMITTLIAAAMGNEVAGVWESTAWATPDSVADRLLDNEFTALAENLADTLGKVLPAGMNAQTQPATQTAQSSSQDT